MCLRFLFMHPHDLLHHCRLCFCVCKQNVLGFNQQGFPQQCRITSPWQLIGVNQFCNNCVIIIVRLEVGCDVMSHCLQGLKSQVFTRPTSIKSSPESRLDQITSHDTLDHKSHKMSSTSNRVYLSYKIIIPCMYKQYIHKPLQRSVMEP